MKRERGILSSCHAGLKARDTDLVLRLPGFVVPHLCGAGARKYEDQPAHPQQARHAHPQSSRHPGKGKQSVVSGWIPRAQDPGWRRMPCEAQTITTREICPLQFFGLASSRVEGYPCAQ